MDSLETSQVFYIENDSTGFLHNNSSYWKGVSEQTIVSLLMFQKVFQAFISSYRNINLWFSFPLWSVTSRTSHPEHFFFLLTVAQKFILNNSLVFKLFVFFSGYIEDLFTKKLWLRLPFLHRNLNWKSIVLNGSFFACYIWNIIKLFCNSHRSWRVLDT